MLQTLLAERFQLKFHRETKELPAYDLVVGNTPPKLKLSAPDVESRTVSTTHFRTNYINISISELVLRIGPQFDRPLFGKTGYREVTISPLNICRGSPIRGACPRRRQPLSPNSIPRTKRHRSQ